jgi:hypothetical protein
MAAQNSRGGLLLPVLVIVAGILLLLNNLNVLDWSVWGEIAKFWPVLLILGGGALFFRQLRGGT